MYLRKLTIQNFKGIKSFNIDFTNKETFIYGDNGTGKTTLFDSYMWLLHGKDSQGLSDSGKGKFEIRPLDTDNNPEHNLEHKVEAVMEHDGIEYKIGRLLTEKWVKEKGTNEVSFQGMETIRFWNDAPIKEKDFNERLSELFTNGDIFKLLSDPFAFSCLHWTKRKQIVSDICGITESDNDILRGSDEKDFLFLKEHLKSIAFNDLISKKKFEVSELEKKLKEIPVRINQEKESMPEMPDCDALNKRYEELRGLITSIDTEHNKFLDAQREATKARQDKLTELYSQMNVMINNEVIAIRKKYNDGIKTYEEYKTSLNSVRSEHESLLNEVDSIKNLIKSKEESIEALRNDFRVIQKEKMPENSTICPTCRQTYPETKLTEIKANFNVSQKTRLDKVNEKGKTLSTELSKLKEQLISKQEELNTCSEILKVKEEEFKSMPVAVPCPSDVFEMAEIKVSSTLEYRAIKNKYDELNNSAFSTEVKTEDANIKNSYLNEMLTITEQLSIKDEINRRNENILKLEEDQKDIVDKILDYEHLQEDIDDYVRYKTTLINERVCQIFKNVRFKFFEYQINGGFNDQMCEIMCNGVDWVNMNFALQVNSGMEIIKAMQESYNVIVPIWIDKRESVNDLFETNAQVINLCVSRDEKLTIKDF